MDKGEAREVLRPIMARYRKYSYAELTTMMDDVDALEVERPSGVRYQIEVEVFRNPFAADAVHVIGGIDDGGLRSAFSPLTEDFLIRPDGSFVGE